MPVVLGLGSIYLLPSNSLHTSQRYVCFAYLSRPLLKRLFLITIPSFFILFKIWIGKKAYWYILLFAPRYYWINLEMHSENIPRLCWQIEPWKQFYPVPRALILILHTLCKPWWIPCWHTPLLMTPDQLWISPYSQLVSTGQLQPKEETANESISPAVKLRALSPFSANFSNSNRDKEIKSLTSFSLPSLFPPLPSYISSSWNRGQICH